ncbi:MAG: hypothetical protein HY867_18230 [Chloroflexi bacterium]|nr:hypothetical protein [Chloroflexota bacterium]
MKTLKSIFEKHPSHFWTGLLGGVIFVIWFASGIYIQNHSGGIDRNFFVFVALFAFLTPVFIFEGILKFLSLLLVAPIALGPLYQSQFALIAITITAKILTFILSDMLFVGVGVILGKRSKDPEQEKKRRAKIAISLSGLIVICFCFSLALTVISNIHIIYP